MLVDRVKDVQRPHAWHVPGTGELCVCPLSVGQAATASFGVSDLLDKLNWPSLRTRGSPTSSSKKKKVFHGK